MHVAVAYKLTLAAYGKCHGLGSPGETCVKRLVHIGTLPAHLHVLLQHVALRPQLGGLGGQSVSLRLRNGGGPQGYRAHASGSLQ